MPGQPKRLFRNYPRRNGGNGIVHVLILFLSGMFSALSAVFLFGPAFVFCARLAVHYLAVYLVLANVTLTATATATSTMAVYKRK